MYFSLQYFLETMAMNCLVDQYSGNRFCDIIVLGGLVINKDESVIARVKLFRSLHFAKSATKTSIYIIFSTCHPTTIFPPTKIKNRIK